MKLLILLLAALGGAGVLIVELSAVRMIAPWFGTSLAVWTNVIGVVLLALALGYLLGARLSQGAEPLRRLALVFGVAAVLVGWLPSLAAPVAGVFMPRDVTLTDSASLLAWGSLATSLVLFLPGGVVMGAIGPLAVEALGRATGSSPGAAGGRILCASTLGSLAGTFATSHLLLPELGLSRTFLGAALLLIVAGVLTGLAARASRAAVVAPVLLLLPAFGWVELELPAPAEGQRELARLETAYQWARVVETGQGTNLVRRLVVDEGLDSYQSVWRPDPGPLGEGYYYDFFALPPWWDAALESERDAWRVAVLGLGAGTAIRVLEGALPPGVALDWTGIELDPGVVELGRAYLDLTDDGRVLGNLDARAGLRALGGELDQLVVDVYAHQFEIPPHLATAEFFGEAHDALRPGGWLTVNVGGWSLDDPVLRAVGETVAHAFGERVLALRVPAARNFVLVARRGARPLAPGEPGFRPADALPSAIVAKLEVGAGHAWFDPPERPPLTDDRCPLDRLQLDALRQARGAARAEG